jgi:hypothetical protein
MFYEQVPMFDESFEFEVFNYKIDYYVRKLERKITFCFREVFHQLTILTLPYSSICGFSNQISTTKPPIFSSFEPTRLTILDETRLRNINI